MTNEEILEELDRLVYGHTEAKKTLITMLSRSRMRWFQKYIKEVEDNFLLSPMKVLLVGSSGTGKTHLVESLQKVVHFPLIRIDATNLNPTGASGGTKSDDLQKQIVTNAIKMCQDYPYIYQSIDGAVDRTIVFIDEVDKLGTSFESSGNWNKHVQSNFLTLLDNREEFAGVSFVLAGAFGSITEIKEKPKSLGFTHNKQETKELIDTKVLSSGLIPEIVGRVNAICELDVFTDEQLLCILKERVLPKKILDLAAYQIFDAVVPDDVLERISKDAALSGQGVRFLHRALDKELLHLEFSADVEKMMFMEWSSV